MVSLKIHSTFNRQGFSYSNWSGSSEKIVEQLHFFLWTRSSSSPVLALLFVKYVSDRYAGVEDALIEVPQGGSFHDIVKLKGDKEMGDKINKIITKLAEANDWTLDKNKIASRLYNAK